MLTTLIGPNLGLPDFTGFLPSFPRPPPSRRPRRVGVAKLHPSELFCFVSSFAATGCRQRPDAADAAAGGVDPVGGGAAAAALHRQDAHGRLGVAAAGPAAHRQVPRLGRRHGDAARPVARAALHQERRLGLHRPVRPGAPALATTWADISGQLLFGCRLDLLRSSSTGLSIGLH